MRLGPRWRLRAHSPQKPPERALQADRQFQGLKAEVCSLLLVPTEASEKSSAGGFRNGCLPGKQLRFCPRWRLEGPGEQVLWAH